MKNLFLIALYFIGLSVPIITYAQDGKWEVTDYKVSFKIKNAGFTVHGSFKGLDANIDFDERHPEQARIHATVDAKTIKTGINMRDNDLKEEKYFDVAHYPEISMESVSIEKTKEDGKYLGKFKLTIKNTTKMITFPFTFTQQDDVYKFSSSFSVDRLDFGVGTSSFILADSADVRLVVKVKH